MSLLKLTNNPLLRRNVAAKLLIQKRFLEKILSSLPIEQKIILSGRPRKVKYLQPALYGGRHFVTMLPGHGIGPEMMEYVRDIFKLMTVPVDFEIINNMNTQSDVKQAILSVLRNGCCIKGNIDVFDKILDSPLLSSPNVAIRKKLDLYANLNVIRSYKNIECKYKDLDLIIIRQNTEGEYSLMEHENVKGVVESMKVATRYNCQRIAFWAAKWTKLHKRKKITIVHKANIMKLSDGLFLTTVRDVIKKHYPYIQVDDMIVDNCCMQMVTNPKQFDVLLCPNLYGSIICNVACGLVGGGGLLSGSNFGDTYAAFETASRSTGTAFVGKNNANPCAMLNAAVDLLYYLNLSSHAMTLQQAIKKTLEVDNVCTADIGGCACTSEVVDQIKKNLEE